MLGTLINSVAVVAGALLGSLFRGGFKDRTKETILNALGLAVVLIGVSMGLRTENLLVVLGSLVLGGALGEYLDIEAWLQRLGKRLEERFAKGDNQVAQAFVTTSLIYCVGAMAVTGSLESGLTGNHSTLIAKATIDGVSSVIFASTMGIGVAFSALSVLVYQGALTLMASAVAPFLTDAAVREMTATGGILIIAIGLGVLNIKKIRVGNLLPAVFFALLIGSFLK